VAAVSFDRVGKTFDDGTQALVGLTLTVEDGEFLVLVGPSGCGKTTALRIVAGLETLTEGQVSIGDQVMNADRPGNRDVAMVFQNYALYPHMTVFENIGFGLRMRRTPRAEIKRRVEEIGKTLGLSELMGRKPRALSGGQRQRVAMGRAIVRNPSVFLMDEPLSNLDAGLRVQMRTEIARIQRKLNATTIYVTHDQVEAMTMADRVAVMRRGRLQQVGVPQDVYDLPANLFVASFIGSPAMNLLQGSVRSTENGLVCTIGGTEVEPATGMREAHHAVPAYRDQAVAVGVRPEHLRLADGQHAASKVAAFRGTVLLTEALGAETLVHVEVEAVPVVTSEILDAARSLDATVVADIELEARQNRTTIVARLEPNLRFRPGDSIEVHADTDKLYFFDLEDGVAIR
jgi:multiple sugar transport system ATP-binding protein